MTKKNNYEMALDTEFYNRLINAEFFELDEMIFIKGLVRDFEKKLLELTKSNKPRQKIEKYLNHIPMEFISTIPGLQEKYGAMIVEAWEKRLSSQFPNKKLIVKLTTGSDKNLVVYSQE